MAQPKQIGHRILGGPAGCRHDRKFIPAKVGEFVADPAVPDDVFKDCWKRAVAAGDQYCTEHPGFIVWVEPIYQK